MRIPFLSLPIILTLTGAGSVQAQAPREVADLVGARGAGGEAELQRRGYRFVRTQTGDDRKWSNWWNPVRRQCLSVVTYDGRYQSITAAPAPDCDGQTLPASGRRRDAYRPDIGFRAPSPQVGAPSYADAGANSFDDAQVELGLVCFGDGQRPQAANRSGWTWNSRTRRYDYGSRTELTQEHFDASLMLQFSSRTGRIRLPKKLIPPIHSRGQDDWWTLDNVSLGNDLITATYRLNGLNKPRLMVDRRSGRITVVGTGDYAFRGTCDRVAEADSRRF